jgi:hypothetical protein
VRVCFERAVMDRPQEFGRHLDAIVLRCRGEREGDSAQHRWVVDDLDAALESAWLRDQPSYDPLDELVRKLYREEIDAAGSAARLLIVDTQNAPAPATSATFRETPARAREILEKPLYVIVENGTGDWHFLCAMARTYPQPELVQAIAKKWLLPEHAGGTGEFKKQFDHLVEWGVPPWRIAVLMDSDRLEPGPVPPENDKKRKELEELGAKVFVLFKREIENYLPPSLLNGKRHRKVLGSLLNLSRVQQDHYDMKHGFARSKDGSEAVLSEVEQRVFGNVDAWNQNRLVGGFGSSIRERFKDATVSREEMDHVCSTCPGEIEGILRTLEEML